MLIRLQRDKQSVRQIQREKELAPKGAFLLEWLNLAAEDIVCIYFTHIDPHLPNVWMAEKLGYGHVRVYQFGSESRMHSYPASRLWPCIHHAYIRVSFWSSKGNQAVVENNYSLAVHIMFSRERFQVTCLLWVTFNHFSIVDFLKITTVDLINVA